MPIQISKVIRHFVCSKCQYLTSSLHYIMLVLESGFSRELRGV